MNDSSQRNAWGKWTRPLIFCLFVFAAVLWFLMDTVLKKGDLNVGAKIALPVSSSEIVPDDLHLLRESYIDEPNGRGTNATGQAEGLLEISRGQAAPAVRPPD